MMTQYRGVRAFPYQHDPGVERELRRDWWSFASCKDANPEEWHPTTSRLSKSNRAAVAICMDCPVRLECLDFALDYRSVGGLHHTGIWGGTTDVERDELRKARR